MIDVSMISVSNFLSYLSSKVNINDIEINSENIDNIIVRMYKEYEI